MVAPEELPSFHIECKGTRDFCLSRGGLLAWEEQLKRDCPKNKQAVLFWKANNTDWICIRPVEFLHNLPVGSALYGWIVPTNWVCLDAVQCVKMMRHYENDLKASSRISGRRDESGTGAEGTGFADGTKGDSGPDCEQSTGERTA